MHQQGLQKGRLARHLLLRAREHDCLSAYASQIDSCGCLGGCGMGPNVVAEASGEVFKDVYKPKSVSALLEVVLGLEVADEAVKASVHRMYAERAMRANKLDEALGLLTTALNTAGALRLQGAMLLAELLHLRADVHTRKGDGDAAVADRERAESLCSGGTSKLHAKLGSKLRAAKFRAERATQECPVSPNPIRPARSR